jgi:2-dehydropantoate 2-reductase
MRFVVIGAGATGAFLGAHLWRAGEDVTLVARGRHLAAMQASGVRIQSPGGDFTAHPACTDAIDVARDADVVFLTLKAHSLPEIAPRLGAVLGEQTAIVTAQNGIPWWYFERYQGPLAGTRLEMLDPGGTLAANIPAERIVGCVVYPATRLLEPGVVDHIEGTRFSIGELDGTTTARCTAIAAALTRAGLKCPIRTDIRSEIWVKLLGNVAFNPLSVLTRATMAGMTRSAETRSVARAIMDEADAVARALGVRIPVSIDQRLAGAAKVGDHKTSMLQDLESGRPLELEALAGAVLYLGTLLHLDMPTLRCVYACAKLLDETNRE